MRQFAVMRVSGLVFFRVDFAALSRLTSWVRGWRECRLFFAVLLLC